MMNSAKGQELEKTCKHRKTVGKRLKTVQYEIKLRKAGTNPHRALVGHDKVMLI